jgi:thiosulfate reductase cytochrome b subunit
MFEGLHQRFTYRRLLGVLTITAIAISLAFGVRSATAADPAQAAAPALSPLHPTFQLLDAEGNNVVESGQAVSTMKTCGSCHDTTFIEQHSFHADLGLADFGATGLDLAQPWDESRGVFGKWDPLTYRTLTPAGVQRPDLTTAEWLRTEGVRAPGGGPATTSREGTPLLDLAADANSPETTILDGEGKLSAWDWQKSGVVEMNCFLCHLGNPDTQARADSIAAGDFGWANTATLLSTGVVTQTADGFVWQPAAFESDGELKGGMLQIQDPSNENCASCHGAVHTDNKEPLTLAACDLTATTGQVISGQRIADSGLNLQNKETIGRAWDVHAERELKCTNCHYALNNPIHAQEAASARPSHLVYDPRRLEIGEYLDRPNHNFARGESAQYTVDPDLKGSMRRCESCHDAEAGHSSWLPYTGRHLEVLACESCHVPQLYAPAVSSIDWTVLNANGGAVTECRGIEGSSTITGLVTGFQPVLMQRTNIDGGTLLAPYNLISSWYWVYDDPNGDTYPVRLLDLQAIYFQEGTQGKAYAPEIVAGFDADGDRQLGEGELRIDSDAKRDLVAGRLAAIGLLNPRIEGQVQPYSINHNVARGEWATRDCQSCHHADSLITQPIQLGGSIPGGVVPTFVSDANVAASGAILGGADGALLYQPQPAADGIYIFGRNRVNWVDWVGALAFVGVLLAVGIHGGLRFLAAMRRPRHTRGATKRVYMYQAYERFWHWLQTITIILLLFTGLIIHRPDLFGIFSFAGVVTVHNVLAAILVINAGLSLFWHVAGGEIRQYIPRPYGFFDQAILQTKYYLKGIFRDEEHPFEKTRDRHLNPLQQVTYFGILNVLLPLQIITGALMWGVQQWPQYAEALGGLPFLAPFHSLVAWLFASFIVAHVYLTTTGHAPLSGIEAMVTGWEEVDVHAAGLEQAAPADGRPDERPDAKPGLQPSNA